MSKVDLNSYEFMMGDVFSNLKNEIKELTFKVKQARENSNWGTYKNLILAYKEIINLYRDIVLDVASDCGDKPQQINHHVSLDIEGKTNFKPQKTKDNMYIDVSRNNDVVYCTVFWHDKVLCMNSNIEAPCKNMVDKLMRATKLEDKNIFIFAMGSAWAGIADELAERGIRYNQIKRCELKTDDTTK